MSGHTGSTTCPNCGSDNATESSDHKPFDYTEITCLECGFTVGPQIAYMELDELNERRQEEGMELLTELPKQEDVW